MNALSIRPVSSLVKIFPDEDPGAAFCKASALRGEAYSFQIAYRAERLVKRLHAHVDAGALTPTLELFQVGLIPAEMPTYGDEDDFMLRTTPGLYPDPLFPIGKDDEIYAHPHQWRSIFCSIHIPSDIQPGVYPIRITMEGHDDSTFGENLHWHGDTQFDLTVLPPVLPEQKIIHTEWFAADCITTWYNLTPLSDDWWRMIEKYIANAAQHGMTMMLTPLFTPPLDTRIGSERPTIQLVSIEKKDSQYTFDFDNVGKWIQLCRKYGIQYFEMPHLFTQWGAKCTPKIVVKENGQEQKLFGWHVASDSDAYLSFLRQFLPALLDYLKDYLPQDHIYFHISDEPGEDSMERYGRLSTFVRSLIGNCPMMDAMSSLKLFKASSLDIPVTASDELEAFLNDRTENLWAYYACLQYKNHLSNRFLACPANRTRVLGIQLYKHQINGFLHWGYNHWYSGLSIKKINPYQNTDADACFPAGDPFVVYPGEHGPINSLRIKLLREAFQDHRALSLLESLAGRTEALRLLEEGIPPVTMTDYPCEAAWLLQVRERINHAVADCLARFPHNPAHPHIPEK